MTADDPTAGERATARAAARLARLQELTARFAVALTPETVLDLVTTEAVAAAEADAGSVVLLDESGASLVVVRAVGYAEEVLARLGRFPVADDLPLSEAVRVGVPVFVGAVDELTDRYPVVRETAAVSGTKGAAALPLWVEGRAIGAIGLSFREAQPFDQPQERFLLAIAHQCAAALERTRLSEAGQLADLRLRQVADTASAIGGLGVEGTVDQITESAMRILGCHQVVTLLRTGDDWSGAVNSVRLSERYAAWRDYRTAPDGSGIYRVVCDTNAPLRLTQDEVERHPAWRGYGAEADRHPPLRGLIAAPLVGPAGENVGVIMCSDKEEGEFTGQDEVILVQLARLASTAVEKARLLEAEQRARQEAELAGERLEFLSEATRELAASLRRDEVLDRMTRLAASRFADWASIHLPEGDVLRRVSFSRSGGDDGATFERIRRFTTPVEGPLPVSACFRTGQPVPMPEISSDEAAPHPEVAAVFRELGVRAGLAVPLTSRGRVLGVMTLAFGDSARHSDADVAVAVELAARAGTALENATLYEREHGVAEALQRAVLPERLPTLPGVGLAARYIPASAGDAEVGGDWYDAFELSGGRLGIAVGDVVGHGLRAAATMGQLRNALRAYAVAGDDPATVLSRVGMFAGDEEESLATIFYGIVDPAARRLVWASAGHPPPMLATPAGVEELPASPGIPVGVDPSVPYGTLEADLPPGALLVLYTDGLVERRGENLDAGLARLREAISASGPDPQIVCDGLVCTVAGSDREDDICLLAVHLP